jgi:hypothetical protein
MRREFVVERGIGTPGTMTAASESVPLTAKTG